jgi:hypothetical protein
LDEGGFCKSLDYIRGCLSKEAYIDSKTSNGVGHYNCHFDGICASIHPNLVSFAKVLYGEADWVKGARYTPDNQEPVFPEIPEAFWDIVKK